MKKWNLSIQVTWRKEPIDYDLETKPSIRSENGLLMVSYPTPVDYDWLLAFPLDQLAQLLLIRK